jgi:hypothetical protein
MVKFSRWNGHRWSRRRNLSRVGTSQREFWISNGQRNGDHDLRYPRFAWSRYTKLDILCNVALKVIKSLLHRVDRHPPEALEFLDDAILMDISLGGRAPYTIADFDEN